MRLDGSDDTDGSQDSWKRSDCTPWDFSAWKSGKFNYSGGNNNFVLLNNRGKFIDTSETDKQFGLYKKVNNLF